MNRLWNIMSLKKETGKKQAENLRFHAVRLPNTLNCLKINYIKKFDFKNSKSILVEKIENMSNSRKRRRSKEASKKQEKKFFLVATVVTIVLVLLLYVMYTLNS